MSQLWNLAGFPSPYVDPPVLNLPLAPNSLQKCRCVVAAMPFGVAVCIARLIEVDTDTGKMHDSALDRDHKGGRGKLPPAFEPLRVSPAPPKRGIPPQRPLPLWITSSACGPAVDRRSKSLNSRH